MNTLQREIEVRNDVGMENLAMPIAKRQKSTLAYQIRASTRLFFRHSF